jgi:hypothetical protein
VGHAARDEPGQNAEVRRRGRQPALQLSLGADEALGEDVRFKNHGLAPKSAADFAFLLHGFHFLKTTA